MPSRDAAQVTLWLEREVDGAWVPCDPAACPVGSRVRVAWGRGHGEPYCIEEEDTHDAG